tara:strand:- start:92 stop:235 length:144 start_codon:yes stop_codon:yes gene_type:complete
MKHSTKNKHLKKYELVETTWNKGKFGKYRILKKINKLAFNSSTNSKK